MDEFTEQRRSSFGSVSGQYDEARPAYPEKLVDEVLAYGSIARGARALEIGAGTGQATAQFAWRGVSVHAVEPSAEMVEVIRDKFEGTDLDVTAEASDFEAAQLEPRAYDLVMASTSWHWLTPGVRWQRVSDTIKPGGTLAVFWNWPHWRRSALIGQLDEVYERSGADLTELGPMLKVEMDGDALAREWTADAPEPEAFNNIGKAEYNWSVHYPAEDYVSLLGTYGDHLALDQDVRSRLFADITALIESNGGVLELPYSTVLLVARARA